MKITHFLEPHRRKGYATLTNAAGDELARVECWSQTEQGRQYALDVFDNFIPRNENGMRLAVETEMKEMPR